MATASQEATLEARTNLMRREWTADLGQRQS
jgi:hypothetical protein